MLRANHGILCFPSCCKTQERMVKHLFSGHVFSHVNMCCSTSPWGQLPVQGTYHTIPSPTFSNQTEGKKYIEVYGDFLVALLCK